ncbi:hypothetical protein PCANC_18815 [Puccinia coronata f. sp. avenae]|uniref:Chalcone isomerase domain-containing protein n=1 Tax=Puccinia coronata f. sp. avenae TaxID=200324 RepID=A0A2N5SG57_9BASI|nr:hypothetical protein PCANC_18815 [Puccinia coronata f. sp. avenae]
MTFYHFTRIPLRIRRLTSHPASGRKTYYSTNTTHSIKRLVVDINLKWTAPISLALGVGLWFYIQEQHKRDKHEKPLRITEQLPPTIILNSLDKTHLIKDPYTQLELPAQLEPLSIPLQEPLRLVGLGIRTVSILAIKVYLAGFYADPRALRALRVIPGWNDDLTQEKLLAPALHPLPDQKKKKDDEIRGEELMRNLLAAPTHFAIQIAPVRATDFTHLRDGFCRSLTARMKLASVHGTVSETDLERASQSISTFRSFFPTGVSVPKGRTLTLIRTSRHTLVVEYDGKKLGELDDAIVAREMFLAYFADQNPISTKLKESVAQGFSDLYQPRPAP